MNLSLSETMIKAASSQLAGNVEDALAELCRARESGHLSPKLSAAVAHLQFELRQFDAAARTYEDVARSDDGDATTHCNWAVCLERLGEWSQAAAAFGKSVEIDPAVPAHNWDWGSAASTSSSRRKPWRLLNHVWNVSRFANRRCAARLSRCNS